MSFEVSTKKSPLTIRYVPAILTGSVGRSGLNRINPAEIKSKTGIIL